MLQRTPRSTRTYTLVPYTTLFRSLMIFFISAINHPPSDLSIAGRYLGAAVATTAAFWSSRLARRVGGAGWRSEEHTSALQSLMRISYAGFCLKKTKQLTQIHVMYYTYFKTHHNIQSCHIQLH